jgi:hypothetical protein
MCTTPSVRLGWHRDVGRAKEHPTGLEGERRWERQKQEENSREGLAWTKARRPKRTY